MSSHASVSPLGGGKNTSANAAAESAAAAKAARIARQQFYNEKAAKFYGVAMAGIIVLFTVFHWSRFLYSRYSSKGTRNSRTMRFQVSTTRLFRHILVQRVPGFTSVGHALLVTAYLGINVALTVTNVELNASNLLPIAKRLGWIAILNVAFITFLALKNTPLAFMTAYSYERINVLHQVGGYTTIACSFLHAILMCVAWWRRNSLHTLIEIEQISGIIASAALLIVIITVLTLKKIQYELFYVTHIAMYMLFIINVAMHQRHFEHKVIIVTLLAASMWASDRLLRGCRILWYSRGNHATITPLPHGGTRIVLRRSPSRAEPGLHCFLWIPTIRSFESHPFTIVSQTPSSLEFVVAAYDGFTNDLHRYAVENPGASLRASIDGPYGVVQNLAKVADKVILIAGGSGASFTFGTALDIIKKRGRSTKPSIEFIWTVKEQESLTWFKTELSELKTHPNITIALHSTRLPSPVMLTTPSSASAPPSPSPIDDEKPTVLPGSPASSSNPFSFNLDPEKAIALPSSSSSPSLNVLSGRPDIKRVILEAVEKADREDRIVIAACGPDSMMASVRRTAATCIRVDGPSVELYCEQFGW